MSAFSPRPACRPAADEAAESLGRLAANDPAAFFRQRRQLLAQAIASDPATAAGRRRQQDDIDHGIALAGAPLPACRMLTGQLRDNVEALRLLVERLRRELAQ